MKKSKTAALLAASLLIYGGVFSVQAEEFSDGQIHTLPHEETTAFDDININNKTTYQSYGELTVKGNAILDKGTLISATQGEPITGKVTIQGDVEAKNDSSINVQMGAELSIGQDVTLNDSELLVSGNTEIDGDLNAQNSFVTVGGSGTVFTVDGQINTNQFYATDGAEVYLNGGGTMSASGEQSALYAKTGATVNAKNVTFTGGEVAVDSGATLNLTGGTVDAPVDAFTTEGGTITTDGTTINSGVWSHSVEGYTGTVTLNNSTINGGAIGAQDASTITMNGGKANVSRISAEAGSKVYLVGGANAETDNLTAIGQDSEININGNASVTTNNIDAETGTVGVGSTGKLTVNGTANFKDSAQFALSDGATVDVNGKVNLYDASGITVNGSTMTFQSGSELHMNGNDISKV